MKILLLGAAGQVGWQLARSLSVLGEVVALDRAKADLAKHDALAATVKEVAPQVIVNAAAYTAVDKAEQERDLAFAVNATACQVLAREASALGAWLVHYSTDYVFDGSGEKSWTESDATSPVNAYGESKLAGEQAIVKQCERHVILRTSWVYETWGQNFLKTILRVAGQREELNVVADQWGAPTRAALIADVTAHLLRAPQAGVYHLAAAGETSWHGYARFAIEEALRAGVELKTTPGRVHAIPGSEYPTPAKRPANSRLDTTKLRTTFGIELPPWQRGVSAVVRELSMTGSLGSPPPRG